MRTLMLAVVLLLGLGTAGSSLATEPNTLGFFWTAAIPSDDYTDWDPQVDGTTAIGFVMLTAATVDAVGGYELGFELSEPALVDLEVPFGLPDQGFVNAGDDQNHLVTYASPVPVVGGSDAVLALAIFHCDATERIEVRFGPAEPATLPGQPAIIAGDAGGQHLPCALWSDAGFVATINGEGVVATEGRHWSAIKRLFDGR
jgi:hypothetical protein